MNNKMKTMPMGKLILDMALPAMFGLLIIALYNVVDSLFVSRISDNALNAVSLVFPVQNLIICLGVGTGIGVSSLIARSLGAIKQEDADSVARHGMLLSIFNGIGFAIFALIITPFFYSSFTSNLEVVDMAKTYTYITSLLSIFVFISIAAEKTLQGTGNMKIPMFQNIVGAIVNIILDPILIFGLFGIPKMGVAGAAIATIIGQAASMAIGLYFLYCKPQKIHIDFKKFKIEATVLKNIYSVGLPSIVMQSIASVMIMFMNGILVTFSEAAVSVLGIYFKVQSFIFMPVFGISQGSLPILGYSYGARDKKRLTQGFRFAITISLCIMITGTILFNVFSSQIIQAFSSTPEMINIGNYALKTISLSFPFAAIGIIASTLFQGVGRGTFSLVISFVRQLVVLIPFAFLFGKLIGLNGTWLAFPLAEAVGTSISAIMIVYLYKKDFCNLDGERCLEQ